MKNRLAFAGTVALTLASAGFAYALEASDIVPAASDKLEVFKQVGDWTVHADITRGNCLIERTDDVGNAMQMGFVKDGSGVYLGVFTKQPLDVKPDQPIEIAVDGEVYTGESYGLASGTLSGNYAGGYVVSEDPAFVNAIAEGRELVAFPEKTGVFIVDLTGTKKAIDEAKLCNKSLK